MATPRVLLMALAAAALLAVITPTHTYAQDDASWTLTITGQDANPSTGLYRDYITKWGSVYSGTSATINMLVGDHTPGVTSMDVETQFIKGTESSATETSVGQDGTLDVPADANLPIGRMGAAYWKGTDGMFYIYGGFSNGVYRSDMWRFNPRTFQYTRLSDSTDNLLPTYSAERRTTDPSGTPGSRANAGTVVDGEGKLWLIGGNSIQAAAVVTYGDMWVYDTAANTWTWMAGSSVVNAAAIVPASVGTTGIAGDNAAFGARHDLSAWYVNSKIWVFGGRNSDGDSMGDTWTYDITDANGFTYVLGPVAGDTTNYPSVNSVGSPLFRAGAAEGMLGSVIVLIGGRCTGSDGNAATVTFTSDVWTMDTAAGSPVWTLRMGSGADVLSEASSASYTDIRDFTSGVGVMPGRWRSASASDESARLVYVYGGQGVVASDHVTMSYLKDVWVVDLSELETPMQVFVGGQSYVDGDQSQTAYTMDVQAYGLGVMGGVAFVEEYGGFWYGYGGDQSGLQANDLFYIKPLGRDLEIQLIPNDGAATVSANGMFDEMGHAWIPTQHTAGDVSTYTFTVTDGAASSTFTLTLNWVASLRTAKTGTYTFASGTTPLTQDVDSEVATSADFTVPYSVDSQTVVGTWTPTNGAGFDINDFMPGNVSPATPLVHSYTIDSGSSDYQFFYVYAEDGSYGGMTINVASADAPSTDNSWSLDYTLSGSTTTYYSSSGNDAVIELADTLVNEPITIDFTHDATSTLVGAWGASDSTTATAPATRGACTTAVSFTVTAENGDVRTSSFQFCIAGNTAASFTGLLDVTDDGTWSIDSDDTWPYSAELPRSAAGKTATYTITTTQGSTLTENSWDAAPNNVWAFTTPAPGASLTPVTFTVRSETGVDTTFTLTVSVDASTDNSFSATLLTTGMTPNLDHAFSSSDDTINVPKMYASAPASIEFVLPTGASFVTDGADKGDITSSPFTIAQLPAVGVPVTYTVGVVAEDTTTSTLYSFVINVLESSDKTFTATLTTTGVEGGDLSLTFDQTDDSFSIDPQYRGVPASIAFTLADGAQIITTGDNVGTITETPASITLPTVGTTVTSSIGIKAEDDSEAKFTFTFTAAPRSVNSWSAVLTLDSDSSEITSFDDSDDVSGTISIPVARNLAQAAVTLTFTLNGGATFADGSEFTQLVNQMELPVIGASTTKTVIVQAEDDTQLTRTLVFSVTPSSDDSWTAVLHPSAGDDITITSATGVTQTVEIPRALVEVDATLTFTLAQGATFNPTHSNEYPVTMPALGATVPFTVTTVAEDTTTTTAWTINFAQTASTDNSFTGTVTDVATGAFSQALSSANACPYDVSVPHAYAGLAAQISLSLPAGASIHTTSTVKNPWNFQFPASGVTTGYELVVQSESGSLRWCTFRFTTARSNDVSWTAYVMVGEWKSAEVSNSGPSTEQIHIPFSKRDQDAELFIEKASGSTFYSGDVDESPFPFVTPVADDQMDLTMTLQAEDASTRAQTIFRIITEAGSGGSSGSHNGGAEAGTNFTAQATVGTFVSPKVSSNDFTSDTITLTLPSAAAGLNATLQFWLQPGAMMTYQGDIIASPWEVMLGAAPSVKEYKLTVRSAYADEQLWFIRVVVEEGCVGPDCAATALLSLSLPMAILLFLGGRAAQQ